MRDEHDYTLDAHNARAIARWISTNGSRPSTRELAAAEGVTLVNMRQRLVRSHARGFVERQRDGWEPVWELLPDYLCPDTAQPVSAGQYTTNGATRVRWSAA